MIDLLTNEIRGQIKKRIDSLIADNIADDLTVNLSDIAESFEMMDSDKLEQCYRKLINWQQYNSRYFKDRKQLVLFTEVMDYLQGFES